jgi:hypothetical protein
MTKYYYIGTFLPTLSFEMPPEISPDELNDLLRDNLTAGDFERTRVFRRLYDILNLRAYWLNEEPDPWGGLNSQELEDALASEVGLPKYVYEFLEAHVKKEDRLRHFPALLVQAFKDAIRSQPKGFARQCLRFEREWRLVLTGFRAKKLGRDLNAEFQYEDLEDPLVAQILAQKDAKTYEPPEKYGDLKAVFDRYSNDPLGLRKALDEYRFNRIQDLVGLVDTFSFDRVLAYMAQLAIVQKWFELDKEKGIKIVDTIVKEIS